MKNFFRSLFGPCESSELNTEITALKNYTTNLTNLIKEIQAQRNNYMDAYFRLRDFVKFLKGKEAKRAILEARKCLVHLDEEMALPASYNPGARQEKLGK